ncbi:hypothetical protein EI983_12550 [Roseovarius faecimaris]|uniref:Ceramidase n=1 Tax=Roseovarius faecimaris TaxID=2494550 RepID=A0A6I6ISE6_9RHOB|nr:ceramidase domain-containing protein [Roseovarius faecimaris]QGX99054.1 hypothetical protein EI983_12550 [Roseovarius faecimaris]
MTGWHSPVDLYCERVAPGFWDEPLNAVTNLAFVLAALWALRTAKQMGRSGLDLSLLMILAACIGIGSFLFHTFANRWSGVADVLPIWTFVLLCIGSGFYRVAGLRPVMSVLSVLGIVALLTVVLMALPGGASPSRFNGSEHYAPALLVMAVFALLSWWRRHPVAHWIVAATLTFTLSLTFRTIDIALCPTLPFGTHFLWHLLNGLMVGLLLQALIRAPEPKRV